MDHVADSFVALLAEKQLNVSARQLEQFERYYQKLVSWNEKMNLTGITERDQVYIKHFYDSLSVAFCTSMANIATFADIGAGAGFPGIPLKIMFPHLKLTIVDSLNKRIQFLKNLCEALDLSDVNCVHGRAEDVARTAAHRDRYDLVTARAVARLAVLNEFCLPFARKDGLFIAMKGSDIEVELKEAAFSLKELNAKWIHTEKLQLPVDQSMRHLVVIRKAGVTPGKYPRKAGLPLKAPLL